MLQWCTLSEDETKHFEESMHRTSLKLVAAWKSMTAYRDLTSQLVFESLKSPRLASDPVHHIMPSHELYGHLDAFLTQFKSGLDYLIKLGQPIFGRRRWTLRTFADNGKKVANALNNLPADFEPAASELSKFVVWNEEWLGEVIAFRDWINHGLEGGPDPAVLEIWSEQGIAGLKTYCPLFKGIPLDEYLHQMWWNLFHFIEGFSAHLLWARAQPQFRLYYKPVRDDSPHSPWALFPAGVLEQLGHPSHCVGHGSGQNEGPLSDGTNTEPKDG